MGQRAAAMQRSQVAAEQQLEAPSDAVHAVVWTVEFQPARLICGEATNNSK